MIMLVCAIADKATQAFMQPFFVRTKPEAIRVFADAVNDPKTQFHAHPEDYACMHLGEFDDASGDLRPNSSGPVKLVTGSECVRQD